MTQVKLEQLFQEARTHNVWQSKPVDDELLRRIFDAMKWGPTSANSSPARFVFTKPGPEREKLVACMSPMNAEKTRAAPVAVIFAHDTKFFDQLPRLFPQADARSWFAGNEQLAADTAIQNAMLQNGYFIIAARALGLDCGPMAGFDKAKVDAAFFAGTTWRANLVCNLGYGDQAKLFPRNPRLEFAEACKILR